MMGTMGYSMAALLQQLQEDVSLAQHHDGMSTTSKYRVMDDVVKRIINAYDAISLFG